MREVTGGMNITSIIPINGLIVETDEDYPNRYVRYGPDNWVVQLGEDDVPLYDDGKIKELEAAYQEIQ